MSENISFPAETTSPDNLGPKKERVGKFDPEVDLENRDLESFGTLYTGALHRAETEGVSRANNLALKIGIVDPGTFSNLPEVKRMIGNKDVLKWRGGRLPERDEKTFLSRMLEIRDPEDIVSARQRFEMLRKKSGNAERAGRSVTPDVATADARAFILRAATLAVEFPDEAKDFHLTDSEWDWMRYTMQEHPDPESKLNLAVALTIVDRKTREAI